MFVLTGATVHVVTSLELDEVLYLAVALAENGEATGRTWTRPIRLEDRAS